jgi:hypothetical protein
LIHPGTLVNPAKMERLCWRPGAAV